MLKPEIPANEADRLRELRALEILDTPPESDLDEIVGVASYITGCPISIISLIDSDRHWFKAKVGVELDEIPRDISFCAHTVHEREPLIVNDAALDERFKDNPFVIDVPYVRFYVGQPLITSTGYNIGTLCALDRVPRELTPEQIKQIKALARQAVRLIELRRTNRKLLETEKALAEVQAQTEAERKRLYDILSLMPGGVSFLEGPEHRYTFTNKAHSAFFGGRTDFVGKTVLEAVPELRDTETYQNLRRVFETGATFSSDEYQLKLPQKDGSQRIYFVRITFQPHRNPLGVIDGVISTVTDVTASVQTRNELRSVADQLAGAESLLNEAIAVANVGFYNWDILTDHVTFSEQMKTQWGIPAAIKLSETLEVIHADDRVRVEKEIAAAIGSHEKFSTEYRIVRPTDKKTVWILAHGHVTYDETGRPVRFFGTSADITTQKESEVSARKAQKEIAEFLSAAPEAMLSISGPEYVFTYANEGYKKLIGFDPIGKKARDIFTEESAGHFFKRLDRVYKTGEPFIGDALPFRLDKNGNNVQDRWVNIRYFAAHDDRGQITGIRAFIYDVTEQVRLRRELEEAKKAIEYERFKLNQIFQSAPTAMAIFEGEDLRFERVNPEYQKIFPGRELVGKTLAEATPELSSQPFVEQLKHVLRTGEPIVGHEALAKIATFPGGPLEDRYYDYVYLQMTDTDGKPYAVVDYANDVTKTVLAKKSLEEQERRLRHYAEAMPQMAFIADATGDITYFNRRYYDYVGIPKGSSEGRGWQNLPVHHPDDLQRTIDRWSRSVQTGEPYEIEYRLRRHDGEYRWHLGRAVAECDGEGHIKEWFGTNTDIHEQKLLRERLHEATQAAETANSAKSAFLANMSHEIRTPLGAVMGFADLARQADTSKQDLESFLGVIHRNSQQVLRIVDDILDLAKVESGKVQIEEIEFNLTEFLAEFSSLMGFRARENGIDFVITAETDLPQMVISDPTRLRQILTNSVGNAIKFTSRGFVRLSVCYHNGVLEFGVRDTGRGITKEQVEKLFQAFVQADVSTTRKFGGTGLGLVITKRLCQLMGGDYTLESSELGVGSHFLAKILVSLPSESRLIPSKDVLFKSSTPSDVKPHAGRLDGVEILLVEDSPDNQTLLKLILGKQGAQLTLASDGREGVNAALKREFDVIFMDIQMPNMDGHEAARTLRAMGYRKPIIALTAHAMKEEAERAFASGFSGFVSKPIQRDELIEAAVAAVKSKTI